MERALMRLSESVISRPKTVIAVIIAITLMLGSGAALRAPIDETDGFLPPGSPIVETLDQIDTLFSEAGAVTVVTVLFRGDVLTPQGLVQMHSFVGDVVAAPGISNMLSGVQPVVSPAGIIAAVLEVNNLDLITQAEIDAVAAAPGVGDALEALTGIDADGTPVAIATFLLSETDEDRLRDTERLINEMAYEDDGVLSVSSVSPTIIEDEYQEASRTGMLPYYVATLLLIAALIFLFLRSRSDLLLTLGGLFVSIIWVVGAEGWLGPNGLGLLGRPSGISVMIPIIIISLTVDYAIQIISHYREEQLEDRSASEALRTGMARVIVPLALAAVTTIASLLVGLFSPIPAIGDFGVVAGLGVGMSLIVMLTLIPAGRIILDRRRERRGVYSQAPPVAQALPGVERLAKALGKSLTRNPVPYVAVLVVVTVGLGFAATGLESRFSIRDVLPRGGNVLADLDSLNTAIGGSTEMASVLALTEATDARTLLNLQALSDTLDDQQRRPPSIAAPLEPSYLSLVQDWIDDSGQPGDKYDPELASLFEEASQGVGLDAALMQEFLDLLETRDPAFGRLVVNRPDGIDSILVQFPVYTDDPSALSELQGDLEAIWPTNARELTATSGGIISVNVTEEITERQSESIFTTIAVALAVLGLFYWATLRQPALCLIAIGPIAIALVWVLGTMALLNIPYTLITSIITALSIGIGVDYSIHVIHRYRIEFYSEREPEAAAVLTLGTVGSALMGSALTTALGLGVLIFSPVLALQQFGITVAITIAYALIASTLLVPLLMTLWGAYRNMRLRSLGQRMAEELDARIDHMQS